MAIQNLASWLLLDICLIVVTCKLIIGREQDEGFLRRQTYDPAPLARNFQNGGFPMDDAMFRYFLRYMNQMSNNRLTNHGQQNGYDRGVKRIGSEFLGKRSPGVNQASSWDRAEDDRREMPMIPYKRLGSEFIGKRLGSEFIGKRLGSEFLGKRSNSELAESEESEMGNLTDGNLQSGNLNKNHNEGVD